MHFRYEVVLKNTEIKWENRSLDFEVTGCKVVEHKDKKTGETMWLLCLITTSKDVELIRNDLHLADSNFDAHMTILETVIN